MNSKDFAIGILSTTAVIMMVGILIIHSRPQAAYASGMIDRAGGYAMTVGSVSINDEELVFVIHGQSEKMLAYRFDTGRKQLQIVSGVDLSTLRDNAVSGKAGGKKRSNRRRP